MPSGKFAGEIAFTDCTVTVKTVKMGKVYLNRVRAWDGLGKPLIAMRVWSEAPFERGMLMQMQPVEAPKSHVNVATALAALEEEIADRESGVSAMADDRDRTIQDEERDALREEATEAPGAPAPRDAGAEGGTV